MWRRELEHRGITLTNSISTALKRKTQIVVVDELAQQSSRRAASQALDGRRRTC
jgi:K+-sensing histidine kinase KdpD